jgi:hypothetical protein
LSLLLLLLLFSHHWIKLVWAHPRIFAVGAVQPVALAQVQQPQVAGAQLLPAKLGQPVAGQIQRFQVAKASKVGDDWRRTATDLEMSQGREFGAVVFDFLKLKKN